VLSQSASRKHALEPEDDLETAPPKKKSSPNAPSTASTPSTPVKSLTLKNLAVISRSSSTPATSPKSNISAAKRTAPSTLSPLSPKTVGAKGRETDSQGDVAKRETTTTREDPCRDHEMHELTAAANKVTRSPTSTMNDWQKSGESSTRVKFVGPAKIQTWTNKAASQPAPASKTPIPALTMAKSNSTTSFTPSPYRAPITKVSTAASTAKKSSQSVTIQTQTEPKAGDTPTAPVSSTRAPPQPTAAHSAQPSASQPTITPSVSPVAEHSTTEPPPSSPKRHRIISNLDDEFSPSSSDESLPSPPPRDPSVEEIPQQIPTSHKFIVKPRNTSLRPTSQPTNDTPSKPASPARAPDTRLTEVVVKSPPPRINENPMPGPTISELSSLSSQFEEDTHQLFTNDDDLSTLFPAHACS